MPQDKPKISLNLDALEREAVPEPFWITVGGKPHQLVDPQEIPWERLIQITRAPSEFLAAAVTSDKRDEFVAAVNKLPAWKVNRLAAAYKEHFGLPSDPEALASPAS